MRCHYEVLEVSQQANDQDLRAAYRQQALKWHPDKNIGNQEKATEEFKLIKLAYEVLSDPKERAYYDRHRDMILREKQVAEDVDLVNVFKYFTTTCFNGYSDNDESFYAVYRKVFEDIAVEEDQDLPNFGDGLSNYTETVDSFYQHWESFCTALEFEWIVAYDISQYNDRRSSRFIMKENQKLREAARKERTQNVRNLVLFVKKRDPRVRAHLLELQEKREANKRLRDIQREEQKKEKLRKIEEYQEAEWMPLDELEKQLKDLEAEHERAQVGESEEDTLYCIACDKLFMSVKSFENHVRSKKHKQNEEQLKKDMLEEEENLNSEKQASGEQENGEIEENDLSDEVLQNEELLTKKSAKNKKKNKKKPAFAPEPTISDIEEYLNEEIEKLTFDESEFFVERNVRRKKQRGDEAGKKKQAAAQNVEAEDQASPSLPAGSAVEKSSETKKERQDSPSLERAKPAKGKGAKSNKSKKSAEKAIEKPVENVCVTCGTKFSSRNKMFEHLKRTNHAQYKA